MSRSASSLLHALAPRVGHAYMRLLRRTMRLEFREAERLDRARASDGSYILCFWHSRFVMMPYSYPGQHMVVLHSRHRDAQLLVQIMKRFGFAQAWGSSSAGGAVGMRQLLRYVRDGYDVGMTPDGPRGPRRRVQPGVVAVARLSGKPIVPLAFSARPARRLRSWDRTLLPYPFARGLFLYGEPVRVPRDADEAEQERCRLALETGLDEITDAVDRALGLPLEAPREPVS